VRWVRWVQWVGQAQEPGPLEHVVKKCGLVFAYTARTHSRPVSIFLRPGVPWVGGSAGGRGSSSSQDTLCVV